MNDNATEQDTPEQGVPEEATPGPQPSSAPPKLDKVQRLAVYLDKLERLKEARTTLRGVVERELLLEFVRANRGNINEFPLLDTQQQSVIDIITSRSEHPAFDHIRRLIASFITRLNRFGKLKDSKDQESADKIKAQLSNIETLLIKIVQGVVYACGLITDNFEELVLQNLGQAALTDYNQTLKEHPLGQDFWKTALENFVARPVDMAHHALMEREGYRMTREQHYLAIHFPFDFVLSQLTPAKGTVDRTRIQKFFEANSSGKAGQVTLKVVHATIAKGLAFIPEDALPRQDLAYIARLVCIDSIGEQFRDKYLERARAARDGMFPSAEDKALFQFMSEQVVAVGVGAAIGNTLIRDELTTALNQFVPEGMEAIRPLIRDFSIPMLQKLYLALLEQRFLHQLRQLAPDEQGKLVFRVLRSKRVSREAVTELFEHNLNRIRQNKIWAKDPGGDNWLLFRPRSAKQLVGLMAVLQLETGLAEMIRDLWNTASDKVAILVLVDLTQLARTTTNLRARLAEILSKLGIGKEEEGKKEEQPTPQAAENQADPAQPATEQPTPEQPTPEQASQEQPAAGQDNPGGQPAEGQPAEAQPTETGAPASAAPLTDAQPDQAAPKQPDPEQPDPEQPEPEQAAPPADTTDSPDQDDPGPKTE